MNIIKFDIENGMYLTELSNFDSDFHSHPAVEIVLANEGVFTISTREEQFSNQEFAVIDSNVEHKLTTTESSVFILVIEYRDRFIKNYLSERNVEVINGLYVSKKHIDKIILEDIIRTINLTKVPSEYDSRIQNAIDFLKKNTVNYFDLRVEIQKNIPLSYSRVSHLFKKNIGISIKKYLVWCNLRNTINTHLNEKVELMDSLLFNGFYDQPHFNNTYKSFIGTSPARIYNSRILQFTETSSA